MSDQSDNPLLGVFFTLMLLGSFVMTIYLMLHFLLKYW